MEKKIPSILEELYESYPSLKKDEQALIPIVEAFIKTNITVNPDTNFKKELKKKLLQNLSCSSKEKLRNPQKLRFLKRIFGQFIDSCLRRNDKRGIFQDSSRVSMIQKWKNMKIWFSIFATGLAVFGVFSLYYFQLRPLTGQFAQMQTEVPQKFGSQATPSLDNQKKNSLPFIEKKSSNIQNRQEIESPVSSSTHQENSSSQNTKNLSLSPKGVEEKPSNLTGKIPLFSKNNTQVNSGKNTSSNDVLNPSILSNTGPVSSTSLGLGEGFQGGNGGDANLVPLQKSSLPRVGGPSTLGIVSSRERGGNSLGVSYRIQGAKDTFTDANTQVFISQKNKVLPSGNYSVLYDDSQSSFSLVSNVKKIHDSTVSIDAKDIPSPQQVVNQFHSLMVDFGISQDNINFTVQNAENTLSDVFDETVEFNIPYLIQGKEVYDESGKKVILKTTYNFINKGFEFVGPIYHFESTISQAPSSLLFHLPMPKTTDNSQEVIELKKGESVFVKILVNGKYEFIPGNKYTVVSKPKGYSGGINFVYPNLGGSEKPIQIEE